MDVAALERAFRAWLAEMMPAGTYRAWLVETADRRDRRRRRHHDPALAARAAATPATAWRSSTTSTPSRRTGGAAWRGWSWTPSTRWCRDAGITSVALNASRDGQPLYESMGYRVAAAR